MDPSDARPQADSLSDLPQQIGGFRIMRRLASGGTSDVLLARAEGPHGFERVVALKLLLKRYRNDPSFERMFAREAAAYARLSHPAIVKLYDFFSSDGQLVMVLEFVDGLPLNKMRAMMSIAGQKLDDRASIFIGSRVFSALAAAHAARDPETGEFAPVIHRDINPSNVLIPWDGHVKLADFGIAKVTGLAGDTKTGFIKGTYGYMAPEQVKGEAVGVRADVYAASLLLWELLARRKAIQRGALSEVEILKAMAKPQFPTLDSLRPDVDPVIRDAVKRGLEPNADRRSITADEMVAILRASARGEEARGLLVDVLAKVRPPASPGDLAVTQARPASGSAADTLIDPPQPARSSAQVHAAARAIVSGRPHSVPPSLAAPVATTRQPSDDTEETARFPALTNEIDAVSALRTDAGPAAAPSLPHPSALRDTPPVTLPLPVAQGAMADSGRAGVGFVRPVQPLPATTARFGTTTQVSPGAPAPRAVTGGGRGTPAPPPVPARVSEPPPPPPSRDLSHTLNTLAPTLLAAGHPARVQSASPAADRSGANALPAFPFPGAVAPGGMASRFPDVSSEGARRPPPSVRSAGALPVLPIVQSPRRSRAWVWIPVLLVASAAGAGAYMAWQRGFLGPRAATAKVATTSTTKSTATPTLLSTSTSTPTPTPTTAATARPTPAATPAVVTMGDLVAPKSAGGHRIFVDGRVVGEAPGTFHVRCGAHTVRVGSSGAARAVDVPCGAAVTLTP